MFCTNCGKEIKEGNRFCTNCGKPVNGNKNIRKLIIIGIIIILIIVSIILIIILYNKKQNNEVQSNDTMNIMNNEETNNYTDVGNNVNTNTTIENNIEELKLQNLDFEVLLKQNGDMEVTETWNIEILDTNTLFKTFELDKNKYDGVANVKVEEILSDGSIKEFKQIDTEMYHVTPDSYYALINSNNQFEIAWGVNAKNEVKTYKITYTIEGAVKLYNDCAELYWTFLGTGFNIPIESLSGKISTEVKSNEEILMWGHSNNYENGNVKKIGTDIIFTMNDFQPNDYLEIRLALPKELFNINEHSNINKLEQIMQEEQR